MPKIMLNILRDKHVKKNIFIFIVLALISTFVITGVQLSQDEAKSYGALAKFENRKISVQEYLDSYRAVERQAAFMYGDKLAELRDRINFRNEAWDRLLILEYAKQTNVKASDKEVVEWITKQEGFQKDGKFDDGFYRQYVTQAFRTTPRQFEEEIRQMLTIGKVQDKVQAGLGLDDEKLKTLYEEELTEKDIVYGILPKEAVENEIPVTDKDIEQLYEMTKDKLTAPEQVKLSYVFVPVEQAEASKAVFEDLRPLEEISADHKLPIKETSFFSRNDSVAELADAPDVMAFAFASEPGETSGWIDSPKGRWRVKVAEKQAERLLSLEEAKEEVKKMFRAQEAGKLAVKKLGEIRAKIADPADFEKVLKENSVETTATEKYKKGMYPAGIWPSNALQDAVVKLKENEISEAFEIPKGAMVVKVTKAHPFDAKKFEEEKEAFKTRTESEKSREELEKILAGLRDKLSMNLEVMKELFPTDSPA
jgi:hypothetical protein